MIIINLIIDCHSHIGNDYFWRDSNIDEYINLITNQNIDMGLLMPVPGQTFKSDPSKRYFIWTMNDGKIAYLTDDIIDTIKNPYTKVNEYAGDIILNKDTHKKIAFIPLIHPVLDTPEYILSLIDKYHPLALKIHGVAAGIGPEDIPMNIINILKQIDIPIITHTDYCKHPKTPIEYMRKKNNPYNWAMFFIKNDLKGYLTHGCRIDFETFKLVNKYDNLVVGIGPDLKISNEKERWVNPIDNIEYLKILRNELAINKIMFDIDYSWNIDTNNNIDYNVINRISKYFTEQEKVKILSRNPIDFFKIKENK